jgi:hypothetical protein
MINRKSATIKIRLTAGKNGLIEIYTYSNLSSDDSKKMTNIERLEYIKSEKILMKDDKIALNDVMDEIKELMKKYTENIKSGSIIWK